ncbi:MAG: putative Histidine kinase [Candidatus Thorarchaeota archaeon]|nr:MAG: putative Histidine kinase [Candidatus Thorarchaeota archaeon]
MNSAKVLFIDDDESTCIIAEKFLAKLTGMDIITVSSSSEALQLFSMDEFDAIISDFEMPEHNGLDVLDFVRKHDSEIPFILFTGKSREDVAIEALNRGATRYIKKDADPQSMYSELAHSIQSSILLTRIKRDLEETRLLNRVLVESMQDMVFVLDEQERYVEFIGSPTSRPFLSIDTFLGKRIQEIMPRRISEVYIQRAERIRNTGTTEKMEYWLEIDGEILWYRAYLSLHEDGKSIIVLASNITTEREAIQSRRMIEDLANSLIHSSPQGILVIRLSPPKILFSNELASNMLGYSQEQMHQLTSKSLSELLDKSEHLKLARNYDEYLEGFKEPLKKHYKIITPSGETKWLEAYLNPIYYDGQKSALVVFRDRTEEFHAEEMIKQRTAYFKALFESAPLPYQSLDVDGLIITVNDAWQQLMGYDREEVIGRNFSEFLVEIHRELFKENFNLFKDTGKADDVRYSMVRKDGKIRNIAAYGRISYNKDGTYEMSHCIIHDVTSDLDGLATQIQDQYFRIIADSTYDWESWIGCDGKLIWVNEAVENHTGYSTDECMDMEQYPLPIIHPHDRSRIHQILTEASKGDSQGNDIPFRIINKSGEERWMALSFNPMRNEFGELLGFRTSIRDTTEREKLSSELSERKAFFKALFNSIPDYVQVWEREDDGTIRLIAVNSSLYEASNGKVEYLIGMSLGEVYKERPQYIEKIREAMHSDDTIRFDTHYQMITQDHSLHLIWQFKKVSDDILLMIATDITDHVKAEEALNKSQERLSIALKATGIGYFELWSDLSHAYISKQWRELHGLTRETISKNPRKLWEWFLSVVHPDDQERFIQLLQLQYPIDVVNLIYRIHMPDGNWRWIHGFGSVQEVDTDSEKIRIIGSARDVTAEMEAKIALEAQRDELSKFTHQMKHDVTNILHNMMGLISLLEDDYNQEHLSRMKMMVEQMEILLKQSIQLADAGLIIGEREHCNLQDVLQSIIDTTIPSSIEIKMSELPLVECDSAKIVQVFQNIISNAVEHGQPKEIRIRTEQREDRVVIIISNDGEEIPKGIREKLFYSQVSTKEHGGLGLRIVKRIIEAHGWKINLDQSRTISFLIHIPKRDVVK